MKNQKIKWLAASGLAFLFLCGVSGPLFAQGGERFNHPDRIEMEQTFFGMRFLHQGYSKNGREIRAVLQENPEAFALYRAGRTEMTLGEITGYIGGFGLGWLLVDLLYQQPSPWFIYGMSAVIIPSIVLSATGTNKVKRSIALYNDGLTNFGARKGTTWTLGGQQYGIGLGIRW